MKVTWFGTASIALESGGTRLLLDPFFRKNKKLPPIAMDSFCGYDAILLTHGHFDHLIDVPKVMATDTLVPVYCTKTPRKSLLKCGVPGQRIHTVDFGETFTLGDFTVKVCRGRHIDFNMDYITRVVPWCVLKFPKTLPILNLLHKYPEANETVIYEIAAEGKRVLVMGSFGVDAMEVYSAQPDLMVFPFSGNTGIASIAAGPLRVICPKRILFDHFDDSFPPLTVRMDVEGYCDLLQKTMPDTALIVPREGETFAI